MSVYVNSKYAARTSRPRHRMPRDVARIARLSAGVGVAILAASGAAVTVFLSSAGLVLTALVTH